MLQIDEIFSEKYINDEMAHFYILEPQKKLSEPTLLLEWVLSVLSKILNFKNIINHEDLLVISEPKGTKFILDEFRDMFTFLNYRPTRAKRKFVIITDSAKLSTAVYNKLLKTLEEPPVATTIFLLNPTGSSILQTVQSRGIKLRIPINMESTSIDITNDIKHYQTLSLLQLIEEFKQKSFDDINFLSQFIAWSNNQNLPADILQDIEKVTKEFKEDQTYHNAATHRLYALAKIIKTISIN